MSTRSIKTLSLLSALFAIAVCTFMFSQRAVADDFDPPDRVARLCYLQGSVSFQPAGETDWDSAVLNRPLTTGDSLWTDAGARAEVHLGSATIHLSSRTAFSFLSLDDRTVQIQLSEGTLNIRVRRVEPGEDFEVDTPNQAFSILQPGEYRIQSRENGNSTIVTVRSGLGEVTGAGRTYTVGTGLSGTFTGIDTLEAHIFRAGDTDEFDEWSEDRDRRYDGSQSVRYVSPYVVGYEDLDDYGFWRPDPNYGYVWIPRVASGWAPYRYGHWVWISPWGWTWIDDAPWGYAPFHYGRWVSIRGRWCWVPGPIAARPVYAPALVAFVGGPRFGFGISVGGAGGGNVGWFPLGPREVYVPGYNASREYVNRVNIGNTSVDNGTITNVYDAYINNRDIRNFRYANRNVPGGVTAVPRSVFVGAQPVAGAAVQVRPQDVRSAPVDVRANIAPTIQSVFGAFGVARNRVAQPPPAIVNRTVVAKAPPPPAAVPFERQQQQLASHPGQPLARKELESLRPSGWPTAQPRVRQAPPGRQARPGEVSAQPNAPPTPPAVNVPTAPVQPGRPIQEQPKIVPPNAPPTPPAANAPTAPVQPGRPIQEQPKIVPPSAPPTPPAVNVPTAPVQPGRPVQEQPRIVPPSAPPTPPAVNVPTAPVQPGRPNREEPQKVQPANPPPNAPPSNAPPARTDRQPDRTNQSQPADQQPKKTREASTPPKSQADHTANETPQEAKDRQAREKKDKQDDQSPQR
jgi:hypothetical protein